MNRRPSSILLATIFLILILNTPVTATEHQFFETFNTQDYCDLEFTTALWDTQAGEIRLPPFEPSQTGSYNTSGTSLGIALDGNLAFVCDGIAGLLVFDVSDPANPAFLGSVNTPGSAWGVAVAGDRVFVGDSGSGLQVVDVSDPSSPAIIGSYLTGGTARGIAISGDLALVADGSAGLQVIDISDVTAPALLGTYNTPGEAMAVAVDGNLVFVADRGSGLQIIDITSPENPTFLGNYDTPGDCWGVDVDANYVYLGDGLEGLHVVYVGDPTNPTFVATLATGGSVRGVDVKGDVAYVCDYGMVRIVDVENPTSPAVLFSVDNPGVATQSAIRGNYLFIADGESGLQVFQHRVFSPYVVANTLHYTGFDPWGLVMNGNYLYIADQTRGVVVVNVTDPDAPVFQGSQSAFADARDIAVADDNIFVVTSTGNLLVGDIHIPGTPVLVATLPLAAWADEICIEGDVAYVVVGDDGLMVLDISDPTNPAPLGYYWTNLVAGGIDVAGDLVYLATSGVELEILDASDPSSPVLIGSYDIPGGGYDGEAVLIAGNRAYLASTVGLHILDVTDPTNPVLLGTFLDLDTAISLAISGDYLDIGELYSSKCVCLDVSEPASPGIVFQVFVSNGVRGIELSGDLLYMTSQIPILATRQLYERSFDTESHLARSTSLPLPPEDITHVKFSTSQAQEVYWKVTPNGWVDQQWIETNDETYHSLDQPVTDLRWGSVHLLVHPDLNPYCSELKIQWLSRIPYIDAVVDVPGDQGGWVRVHFSRSGYDDVNETVSPIVAYYLWRRVDDEKERFQKAKPAMPGGGAGLDLSHCSLSLLELDGKFVHVANPQGDDKEMPAGIWEVVGSAPGAQLDEYVHLAPTVADSSGAGSGRSVFLVTAHTQTPSVWYASYPDSGYSVDNIAPAVPEGFQMGEGSVLAWDPASEPDFQYFTVYGSAVDYLDETAVLIENTIGTELDVSGQNHGYFLLTASDYSGNESGPAVLSQVTSVSEAAPTRFALHSCVPNPFNPETTIRYDLPEPARVNLRIYDLTGRLVRTLVVGELVEVGRHETNWRGLDDSGRQVAAGVYIYRLEAGAFSETKRMVLIK